MKLWYNQANICISDDWFDETESIQESETIDYDYYGLTDDEIYAFNELRKDIYYDIWLSYVQDWD